MENIFLSFFLCFLFSRLRHSDNSTHNLLRWTAKTWWQMGGGGVNATALHRVRLRAMRLQNSSCYPLHLNGMNFTSHLRKSQQIEAGKIVYAYAYARHTQHRSTSEQADTHAGGRANVRVRTSERATERTNERMCERANVRTISSRAVYIIHNNVWCGKKKCHAKGICFITGCTPFTLLRLQFSKAYSKQTPFLACLV